MSTLNPSSAYFIGSDIYRGSSYGKKHPLSIPRVPTCIDLCRALGWLPSYLYIDSPCASTDELTRFHDPAYVAAVAAAEATQSVSQEIQKRFGLGANGNPVFPEVFRRPATACGGSLLAADLLTEGAAIIYNPAGGTHHGRPGRASGFCYFNDPVLAILRLLDRGVQKLVYLDIDAHHGDGVQRAFENDPRVRTVSVHEDGRWPMLQRSAQKPETFGGVDDTGGGNARNIPVPNGLNDSEMNFILDAALRPLTESFYPEVIVLQAGCDALADDPLSQLALSNRAILHVVEATLHMAPKILCLGGGGYNPWSVGRAWAGIWGILSNRELPEDLPPNAVHVLDQLTWTHRLAKKRPTRWTNTLLDPPFVGTIRQEVRQTVARVLTHGD